MESDSLSQEESIRRLTAQIDSLAQVTDHDFPGWRHRTLGIIERIFGEDSRQARTFRETKVARSLSQLHRAANDSSVDRRDILNTATLRSVLFSFMEEIQDFGLTLLSAPHAMESEVEEETRVIAYLKKAYLQHPSQRPARVCPTLADIMANCRLSKSRCYEIACRLESLGLVEWVAKQAEGEFVRVQSSIVDAIPASITSSNLPRTRDTFMIPGRWMSDDAVRRAVERLLAMEQEHKWEGKTIVQYIAYDCEASPLDIETIFHAAGQAINDLSSVLDELSKANVIICRTHVSVDRRKSQDVWTMDIAQRMAFERNYGLQFIHATKSLNMIADKRKVFVVHGRNDKARRALFDFLRSIHLHPLEWSEIVHETGKGSPYIGEVLDKGFAIAQAVVVLMTPDDEARLRDPLHGDGEPPHETALTPQPRPNVLFEAGMALGLHPDRTIIVELGFLRPVSDLFGRHVVRMNNSGPRRQDLAQRLQTAGCSVDLAGRDWHTAGDFASAIS